MALDQELLDILVCPKSKGALELVDLPEELCRRLLEKYREHFTDEEPEIRQGLLCRESGLVYPIVSDIPVMMVEDAVPAAELGQLPAE